MEVRVPKEGRGNVPGVIAGFCVASRSRHTRCYRDWSSDVCSSDLDQALDAYGIWMGLEDEDTLAQIREALEFIGDQAPATFGGDFNTEPGSPVAQAIEA